MMDTLVDVDAGAFEQVGKGVQVLDLFRPVRIARLALCGIPYAHGHGRGVWRAVDITHLGIPRLITDPHAHLLVVLVAALLRHGAGRPAADKVHLGQAVPVACAVGDLAGRYRRAIGERRPGLTHAFELAGLVGGAVFQVALVVIVLHRAIEFAGTVTGKGFQQGELLLAVDDPPLPLGADTDGGLAEINGRKHRAVSDLQAGGAVVALLAAAAAFEGQNVFQTVGEFTLAPGFLGADEGTVLQLAFDQQLAILVELLPFPDRLAVFHLERLQYPVTYLVHHGAIEPLAGLALQVQRMWRTDSAGVAGDFVEVVFGVAACQGGRQGTENETLFHEYPCRNACGLVLGMASPTLSTGLGVTGLCSGGQCGWRGLY
ncbi:hypothetical protein D3C79_572830 [compost metagenome]